jgi:hypothetical protein
MAQTLSSPYVRLAIALAATIALFVAGVVLFPDAVPVFPAVAVPIWLILFPANKQYDERTRRVLRLAALGGVVTFLAGVLVFLVVLL